MTDTYSITVTKEQLVQGIERALAEAERADKQAAVDHAVEVKKWFQSLRDVGKRLAAVKTTDDLDALIEGSWGGQLRLPSEPSCPRSATRLIEQDLAAIKASVVLKHTLRSDSPLFAYVAPKPTRKTVCDDKQ